MSENIYKNSKVYRVCSDLGDLVYYGSTTNKLWSRLAGHKRFYKKWKDGNRRFVTVFKLFDDYGPENCKIILVENCPCDSKDQLRQREDYYIQNHKCVNKYGAIRHPEKYKITNAKWFQDHKAEVSVKNQAYWHKHKDKINEVRRTVKITCSCG